MMAIMLQMFLTIYFNRMDIHVASTVDSEIYFFFSFILRVMSIFFCLKKKKKISS